MQTLNICFLSLHIFFSLGKYTEDNRQSHLTFGNYCLSVTWFPRSFGDINTRWLL